MAGNHLLVPEKKGVRKPGGLQEFTDTCFENVKKIPLSVGVRKITGLTPLKLWYQKTTSAYILVERCR